MIFGLLFLATNFQQGWAAKNKDEMVCGCSECNRKALKTMAGDHSCGERIQYWMEELDFSEDEACRRIAVTDFPDECGSCACGQQKLVRQSDFFCECKSCTLDVWSTMTDDYSCGARISYAHDVLGMSGEQSCQLVGAQFQDECGGCDPTMCGILAAEEEPTDDFTINGLRCGCAECNDDAWNTDAGGPTCGERISWLVRNEKSLYPSVNDACMQVADREFSQCSACNPAKCNGGSNDMYESSGKLPTQGTTADDGYSEMTLSARTPLYCFPDFEKRTRWRNVWGKYTVEVKESDALCGPSDNKFGTNTVSLADNNQIKLQFKKVGNDWEGSEVRVRLPEDQMPFVYGKYSYSIKSVQVIDAKNDAVIDDKLPPSLILGLFTWDATEDYAGHENFNHEVDIEISRWNIPGNEDLQFLVQPPGDPQMARFYSGGGTSYKQGSRTLAFDWRPAEIEWFGDRGESHVYSSRTALAAGAPDHTQCLPADMEIRMNLWHLFGTSTPSGMEDGHVVEVVIDDFTFTPSGLTEVEEGGVCTKDCQCGRSSSCTGNVCRSSGRKLVEDHTELVNGTGSITTYRPFIRSNSRDGESGYVKHGIFVIAGASLFVVAISLHALFSRRPDRKDIAQSLV